MAANKPAVQEPSSLIHSAACLLVLVLFVVMFWPFIIMFWPLLPLLLIFIPIVVVFWSWVAALVILQTFARCVLGQL
jgi:hypothetical protein